MCITPEQDFIADQLSYILEHRHLTSSLASLSSGTKMYLTGKWSTNGWKMSVVQLNSTSVTTDNNRTCDTLPKVSTAKYSIDQKFTNREASR